MSIPPFHRGALFRQKTGEISPAFLLRMAFFPLLDLFEPRLEAGFLPLFRRAVVFLSRKGIGQALHRSEFVRAVVRILVSLSEVQQLKKLGLLFPYNKRQMIEENV